MNKNCECTNCECKECGWQNPENLEGQAAINAGVSPWEKAWFCEPTCGCCPTENKALVEEARSKVSGPKK
tara:strand:- start:3305 stop:3514 length:210 start_codon:yes stop_codon:yes gene_type:complete